jgi:DNA-binding response OmpR family regulator
MPPVPKILVVEDDDAIRALLVAALRREPFDVHAAVNGAEALNMTRTTEYTVILLDLMMPMVNGIEFLEAFHEVTPQSRTVIFIMTAGDDAAVRRLPSNVVHGIVRKPFDVTQLVTMVREVAFARVAPTPESGAEADVPTAGDDAQPADPPN